MVGEEDLEIDLPCRIPLAILDSLTGASACVGTSEERVAAGSAERCNRIGR